MRTLALICFACAIVLSACGSPTTFGVSVNCKEEGCGFDCLEPNSRRGNERLMRLDEGQDEAFPHLWLVLTSDGGASSIDVEVYEVDREEGIVPRPVLEEEHRLFFRSYDEAFGRSRSTDAFSVQFKGHRTAFTVLGLSAGDGLFGAPDDCLGKHPRAF